MVFHDVGMSLAWTNLFTFVRNKPLNIYSMQKLKLFLLFFVATVTACNFTSCKDDDDDNASSSIVGTWVLNADYETVTVTFMANGRFTESWTESNGKVGTDSGSYTYDGKTLTLIYDDGTAESGPVTVSGNKMTVDGLVFIRV